MADRSAILERVRRLRTLGAATEGNEHEAAAARLQAERLIAKHKITEAELVPPRAPEGPPISAPAASSAQEIVMDFLDEFARIGRNSRRDR